MNAFTPWQQALWDRMLDAHAAGRLPHALLLCGPERLGKRELAEALAQYLLCAAPREGRGCGACHSCRLFEARFQRDPPETRPDESPSHPHGHPGHPDARFVGYALNEKSNPKRMYQELVIEQIRDLSSWLVLSPQSGETKVALIEPAHALTTAASNALLKTLEEPVPGRYLVLVSDQPQRLPATIRSRCQRFELRLPSADEARSWLRTQGAKPDEIDEALRANDFHPGLSLRDLKEGGLALRRDVLQELTALAAGRESPLALAQRWQADRPALRLQYAAEALRDLARRRAVEGDVPGPAVDARTLQAWFEQANGARAWLRTPLRQDLMLADLLQRWRQSAETGRVQPAPGSR